MDPSSRSGLGNTARSGLGQAPLPHPEPDPKTSLGSSQGLLQRRFRSSVSIALSSFLLFIHLQD